MVTRMDRTRTRYAGRRARRPAHDPAEANTRLTAGTAVVLLVLLAAEGVTILRIRGLISAHVFIGMVLVPPVLVKTCSTVCRFARYYLGRGRVPAEGAAADPAADARAAGGAADLRRPG
jgi:hypothetical protein